MTRVAGLGLAVAVIGLVILDASHHFALDVVGAILLAGGGLIEGACTLYIVATRGLFGGRDI
jgi:hypothetical protein